MFQIVYILSEERFFSQQLSEYLERLGCKAKVISKVGSFGADAKYLVVIDLQNKFVESKTLVKKISEFRTKTVIVSNAANDKNDLRGVAKQIFVDNVVPGFSLLLSDLYKISKEANVYLPKEAWFAAASLGELFEKIGRELFSFAQDNKVLFGKLFSYREFASKVNPKANIYVNTNLASRLPRKDIKIEETNTSLNQVIEALEKKTSQKVVNKKSIRLRLKVSRNLVTGLMLAFLWLVTIPYLLLLTSAASTVLAYKMFTSGRISASSQLIKLSINTSEISYDLLTRFSMPFSGSALAVSKGSLLFQKVLSISEYVIEFQSDPKKSEKIKELSEYLHLELDSLYRELGYFEKDPSSSLIPQQFLKKFSFDEIRSYVLAASKLSENIPEILGYDRPKTYLLMLQNNMELRPTGGFLGSFALLTFSKGELIDDVVYDVYSADGQLKGYIKPPDPIVEYLGEASWKMRDSNWDPDFPTSAVRAEWFLDKTLDRSVDGVIAINLETIQKYLEVLGPLYLTSFGDAVDSKNIYEKVQYEVENDFFPGSRKKAQYLSALSEALTGSIKTLPFEKSFDFLAATVANLKSRDIQIYLHDSESALAIAEQGWDGSVPTKSCRDENCMDIFSGFVEANVGVNKANYYIKREVNTKISLQGGFVEQEVALKLTNSAPDQTRVPEQRYKAYVRAIAPLDSQFQSARIIGGSETSWIDVDIEDFNNRAEYGALVDILPGEEKTINFIWRFPTSVDQKGGKINFSWWKQSGVSQYPFIMTLDMPDLKQIKSQPPFYLTQDGGFSYNTTLTEDLDIEIEWQK